MTEPHIVISGHLLTDAQAMTIRVAVQEFAEALSQDGLGDDPTGIALAKNYLARVAEINRLLALTAT